MKQIMLTNEDLGSLTMSLAHLIHAGIGTADALYLLSADGEDPGRRELLEKMSRWADEGVSLAECFRNAGCFPDYLCTLLQVGQQVGKTEPTLTGLSRYYHGRSRLYRQLRSALVYPAVLLAVLLAVLVVLLVWVLPVFDDVYAQLGASLTGVAGVLLTAGQLLGKLLPWLFLALAGAAVLLAIPGLRTRLMAAFRKKWGDRGVFATVNTARFIQALSLGMTSGMTAQEAVQMASALASADVPEFQARCQSCLQALEDGSALAQALRQSGLLPPAECRLLEAGSRSGQGEAALEDIAQRLLDRSEDALAQAAEKIEPAVVIAACAMIGLVLLSVMLPLVNIMTAIG